MIISKINTENYSYFNLHAEEVITSNFINDDNSGIYLDRLQTVTILRVINKIPSDCPQNIVFDFSHLRACQPNLSDQLVKLKASGHKILLINILETLATELHLNNISNSKNVLNGDTWLRYCLFEDSEHPLADHSVDTRKMFEEEFKKKIKNFIMPHDKPHTSSFVYLTSFVNMKGFISREAEFLLFSLYKLAMKVKRKWDAELKEKPILICQSLNSSYLVSILSTMLKLDILIFDKIGPVNNLYDRIDSTISKERKYIVVSDLVCLGTEVKIVKNIIQFIGGKCLGDISLIKTETLSKSEIKSVHATIAVFSIKRENNKELNYNITTNLEPLV